MLTEGVLIIVDYARQARTKISALDGKRIPAVWQMLPFAYDHHQATIDISSKPA